MNGDILSVRAPKHRQKRSKRHISGYTLPKPSATHQTGHSTPVERPGTTPSVPTLKTKQVHP